MNVSARIAGVEFHGDEVRLAVVKSGKRAPVVLELHSEIASYDEPGQRAAALAEAVRGLVGGLKHRPAAFVLAVPGRSAVARLLSVPFRGARKVKASVPFELEPYLACPLDDLAVDQAIIREQEDGTEVLAAGVRRVLLEEELGVLAEAGVEAEGANLDVSGLTALWHSQARPGPGLHAVLHVGEEGSLLAVVYNKALAFFRPLAVTAAQFQEAPMAAAREVQNSLRAFLATWKGDDDLAGLTVTGLSGTSDGVAFAEAIQTPVKYMDILAGVKGMDAGAPGVGNRAGDAGAWAVPVSVAWAAGGAPFGFEFCRGELAPAGAVRTMVKHLVFTACLAVLAAAAYAGYCYLDYRNAETEVERIGQEIWDLYARAFPNSTRVDEGRHPQDLGGAQTLKSMQQDMEEAMQRGDLFPVDLLARPTLLAILEELHGRMPDDKVSITELRIHASDDRSQLVTISGEILVEESFDAVKRDLRESTLLRFDEEPVQSSKDGKATFTIKAQT